MLRMKTSASVAVLDEAFDRVSTLDYEVPNRFVNHAPMACEALAVLGLDAESAHRAGTLFRRHGTRCHLVLEPALVAVTSGKESTDASLSYGTIRGRQEGTDPCTARMTPTTAAGSRRPAKAMHPPRRP
jgi:hypothetical protein